MTMTADFLPPALHATRQGRGAATVAMLHCSSSSSSQWRALLSELAPGQTHALAIDLHGHGRSPEWPADERDALAVEARAAWQTVGLAYRDVHLVGHSYGAAVALQMALMQPSRVRSLTLYEPVPFGLLSRDDAQHAAARLEIETVALRVSALVEERRLHDAGRCFTNYWSDGDAWGRATDAQRERIAGRMPTVRRHFNALFALQWGPQQLRRLQMPTLLMHGTRTREPARALAWHLAAALPRATTVPLPGAGHLGPMSHEAAVASFFALRLRRQLIAAEPLPIAA